ncbi:ribosomal maturation YjgA family protein [Frigoriflavimonas asaccharolytica]|uniref:DUF2809 domain-containing protein n=1 Tax=Frigoriflavimonas asaccharolytica TaxID=2735899 RepID=A0A8J8G6T8_9FLAO|nr:DUF2809 domain-containing protein [Frigoriflavimonas asaccharolytica]NRS91047.1 hypothetical protein [Frigoriflavimonas asaccharolytica]
MKFNIKYFIVTIIIFIVEFLIATVFKEIFWLRAYFGDVLVVAFIYTFILSFFDVDKTKTISGVLIFSFVIEFLQYFHFAEVLGFGKNKIAMIVLGNSFSWIDILCYVIGAAIVWLIDIKLQKKIK